MRTCSPGSATCTPTVCYRSQAASCGLTETALEAVIYLGGVAIYLRATRPRDRVGRFGAWIFAAFVPLMHLASAVSPPPAMPALAWTAALAPWPLLLWTRWFDRHRDAA